MEKKANINLFEIIDLYSQFAPIGYPGHFGNYHDTTGWIVAGESLMTWSQTCETNDRYQ